MGTLILDAETVKELLNMRMVIDAVEDVFRERGKGNVNMPSKVYVELPEYNGDFRAMPAAFNESAGVKWVNVHPDNEKKHHLPTVLATIIYSDPHNGYPLAVMDGTNITDYRTGAAAAVATRYLARNDSSTLGLIGCGAQARTQLMAIREIVDLDKVLVHDISKEHEERFKKEFSGHNIESAPIEEVLKSDIVSTTTPVRSPMVKRKWVQDGTHINAIGADAQGKQELESGILLDAKVVIDDVEQATHSGEVNVSISTGVMKPEHIHATIGEIAAGIKPGRENDREITVFDTTGLGLQDIATARVLYEMAREKGLGIEVELVDRQGM